MSCSARNYTNSFALESKGTEWQKRSWDEGTKFSFMFVDTELMFSLFKGKHKRLVNNWTTIIEETHWEGFSADFHIVPCCCFLLRFHCAGIKFLFLLLSFWFATIHQICMKLEPISDYLFCSRTSSWLPEEQLLVSAAGFRGVAATIATVIDYRKFTISNKSHVISLSVVSCF